MASKFVMCCVNTFMQVLNDVFAEALACAK